MEIILSAYILDLICGDPAWWPHPVIAIGKLIEKSESLVRAKTRRLRLSGAFLCAGVVLSVYIISYAVLSLLSAINPLLGSIAAVLLIYSCFSARSLALAANSVYYVLAKGNLPAARESLAHIVGRDTQNLDEAAMVRAVIETVAENTVDGFISPLFYAILGGAPLALAYKAVNTLDSMVGYKNERYLDLGWASAKLDDLANYIPARLMYIFIPCACGLNKTKRVYNIMLRDGQKHPSPNSGIPEAGFAACLDIQLGGTSAYGGRLCIKQTLGDDNNNKPVPQDIKKAVSLMYRISFYAIIMLILVNLILGNFLYVL